MSFSNIKNTLFFVSVILFGMYPLIPERYESYAPIFFIVSSFILFVTSNNKRQVIFRPLVIMSSLFVIFLISCFLSENLNEGFKKIETMLSLIGFPVACFWFLGNIKFDLLKIETIFFKIFFVSNVVFSLVALYLLNFYRNPKFPSRDAAFFRNAISDIPFIGDHSIYISIFLALAIIMGAFIYQRTNLSLVVKLGLLFGQLIIVSLLMLLMSKGVIIALIISSTATFLVSQRISKKIVLGGILIIIITFILLPKQNNRFTELFHKESFEKVDLNNSTSIRFNILKCSIKLVLEHPIFGYGLGDVQEELDSCYSSNGLKVANGRYNSHNQYLFVWLSSGILGLIIFMIYLYYIFNIAIKNKDYFLLNALILFAITFLVENVLSRQSGVILFAFLMNFLVLKNLNSKPLEN